MNDLSRSTFENECVIINSSGKDYRAFISISVVVRVVNYILEMNNNYGMAEIYNMGSSHTIRIIDIAKKIHKLLKDGFDYNCPIIIHKPSKEMDKPKRFILSTEKIKQLGFTSKFGDDAIFSLLHHCKIKYQLGTH